MKIISKEDILLALEKLEEFRLANKTKEYKTLTDSLELMISNAGGNIYYTNPSTELIDLKQVVSKSMINEMNELLENNLRYLKSGNVREHRDTMIAFDKLKRVYDRLQHNI